MGASDKANNRRRELKQKYIEMKPLMGVFIIKNNVSGKIYIEASSDIKSRFNKFKFELKMGSLRIKELQEEWKEYGEKAFNFEVLEELEYDEKEENKDYSEELEIMKIICLEKLNENGLIELYKK